MKARAGVTLIEVLVAIFIMSIGLLALLTLFPVGALSMAQAIKDDRCAQAANQAESMANAWDLRNDAALQTAFSTGRGGNPNLKTNWDGPSYPVFVDPLGVANNLGGATLANRVSRISPSFIGTQSFSAQRWCALQDEVVFKDDGTPDLPAGSLHHEPTITWAYWMRRPNQSIKNVVEMSIIVYSNRNLTLGSSETQLPVTQNADANSITVAANADIRRNSWILDVTPHNPNTAQAKQFGPVQGNWYRVVAVVDTAGGAQLELQPTPVMVWSKPPPNPANATNALNKITTIIVMENVVEVFSKGTGWK